MAINIQRKFMEGLQQSERELSEQRAAELAEQQRLVQQEQRGSESETSAIPEHPQIPPEMRIRKAIGRMFPNPGRGWPEE
jgi:hypothetical protein